MHVDGRGLHIYVVYDTYGWYIFTHVDCSYLRCFMINDFILFNPQLTLR